MKPLNITYTVVNRDICLQGYYWTAHKIFHTLCFSGLVLLFLDFSVLTYLLTILGTCKALRFEFESAVLIQFDSKVMDRFENFRIGRACPLIVVVKRLKLLTALSGTVYRLASSVSDHTSALLNVFEEWSEWNKKFVVLHISFVSLTINYWLLNAWMPDSIGIPSDRRGTW